METHREQELIASLIRSMVVHEEEVELRRTTDEKGVLLTLSVHQEDMGRVMGRGGATVQAVRLLLRVIGAKIPAVISLKVLEPGDSFPY